MDKRISKQKFDDFVEFLRESDNSPLCHYFGYQWEENPKPIPQLWAKTYIERIDSIKCPVCFESLFITDYKQYNDENFGAVYYEICHDCGFWRKKGNDSAYPSLVVVPHSFENNIIVPSIARLSEELIKRKEEIYNLDSKKFEILIGSIVNEIEQSDVFHVGKSHDDGVDLIVIENKSPVMVQVKRRINPNSTEGINTVKLLFASAIAKGSRRGRIYTTADHFSKSAEKWKNKLELLNLNFEMELYSINKILDMMHLVADKMDEHPYLKHKKKK